MGAVQTPEGMHAVSIGGDLYYVDDEGMQSLKAGNVVYDDGSQWSKRDEAAKDLGRGVAHGATMGLADKQFGDSHQSVMQRLGGDDYETVQQRSPIVSTIGDAGGSLLLPTGETGLVAKIGSKGLVGALARTGIRAGEQAAIGGIEGATRDYAEGRSPAAGGSLGATLGGAGSLAADAVGGLVGTTGKLLANSLDATANAARTRPFSIGGSDKQLQALADRFGVDKLPEKLAGMIEDLVPQSGYSLGKNREEYRVALDNIMEQEGPKIAELRKTMGEDQGVNSLIPDAWDSLREDLLKQQASMPRLTAKDEALANAMGQDLTRFEQAGVPKDLTELAQRKSRYQEAGHSGVMGTIPDNAAAASAAEFGRGSKKTLDDLTNYALDETKLAHDAANDKYSKAALLNEQITPKAIREQLNTNAAGVGSMAASAVGGALAGGTASAMSGGDFKSGALTGGGLGLGFGATTGTRNFMRQLLDQPRAMDTLANVARQAGIDIRNLSNDQLARLVEVIQASTGKLGGYLGGQ